MTSDTRLLVYGLGALLALLGAANAWLDIAAASEGPWQMIGMAGVAAVGLAGLWLLPGLVASVGCLLVAMAICAVLGYFRTDPLFLPQLMPILGYATVIWLVSALVMRLVPARLPAERRHLAPVVGGMLALGHLAVGLAMFQIADPVFRLGRDPVAETGDAVREAAADRARARRYGLLIEATLTPSAGEGETGARVRCAADSPTGPTRTFRFRRDLVEGPNRFTATLADGRQLRVGTVGYRYQTQGWPDRGGPLGCRIDAGDILTIWGTPVAGGETGLTVSDTRLIGYGDAATVLAQVAPIAERDARRFGGLAFLVALTGLLPVLSGIRAWRRKRDTPSA
ncbi:MAG: hypothetical protein KDK12_18810 [Rhodobacteraceae bacterium]|nr:hypothetical protein [Paracoccaceae bacterium]